MKKNSTRIQAREIRMFTRCLSVFLFVAWCSASAQVQLVKDLNLWGDPYYTEFGFIEDGGSKLFFSADGDLYVTQGTPGSTEKIYDFNAVTAIIKFNNEMVFAADDGTGTALWKSDGTTVGTVMLKPIALSLNFMNIRADFTIVDGTLFFTAQDATAGMELWKTDGTSAGTVRVKDIKPGLTSSNPTELTAVGDKLFFVAPSAANKGIELWVSDGTSAGTQVVKDIYPGSNSSDPAHLTAVNGSLYFVAKDGLHGRELWQSDGTAAGTFMTKDIRPGAASSNPNKMIDVNGTLFFEAHDGVHGKELWKSDGSEAGTALLKDITPGPSSSAAFVADHINHMISVNGRLFFTAFHNGHRLWTSDGTTAGTIPLTSADAIEFGFLDPDMEVYNNELYFLAQSDWDVTELWKSDGTVAGTQQIHPRLANFDYGTNAKIAPSGSTLFLVGAALDTTGLIGGTALLRSDGTLAGTSEVFDLVEHTVGSYPRSLTAVGNHVFFSAILDEYYTRDLWRSDGTEAGTEMVEEFEYLDSFHEFDGKLLFQGAKDYYVEGWGLWISDGTEAGTVPLKSGIPGFDITYPGSMARLGDVMIFGGNDNSGTGRELWKTDGTPEGTELVKDINPGVEQHSGASHMVTLGDQVIFSAFSPAEGNELWKTDGTSAGTVLIKDIRPSAAYSNPQEFTVAGNQLFFVADDGAGNELWKTDGTNAGTVRVSDISTGNATVRFITPFHDLVLFTAINSGGSNGLWVTTGVPGETTLLQDFLPGNEIIWYAGKNSQYSFWLVTRNNEWGAPSSLWRTDGTVEGTALVLDLNVFSPYAKYTTTLDDVVYFESDHYRSLWRTDGTECGTYPVAPSNMYLDELAVVNGRMFFYGEEYQGYNSVYGAELFSYVPEAAAPCMSEARVAQTKEDETFTESADAEIVSTYPNPSRSQFTVSVPGKENDDFEIEFLTLNGKKVESHKNLEYNRAYQFGGQWGNGVYIMKAHVDGRMVVRKLIKMN